MLAGAGPLRLQAGEPAQRRVFDGRMLGPNLGGIAVKPQRVTIFELAQQAT
jgi:hypothetical protein